MTRVAVAAMLALLSFAIDGLAQQQRQRGKEGLIILSSTSQPRPKATLEGVVLAVDTGRPMANVTVALSRVGQIAQVVAILEDLPPPGPIEPLTTDESGRFAFHNLDADSYRLEVTLTGYTLVPSTQTAENNAKEPPILLRATDTRTVELRLARMGSVSGKVRNLAGDPAAGVPIQALRQASTGESLRIAGETNSPDYRLQALQAATSGEPRWLIAAETRSDERGEYRLDEVVPGSYILAAGAAISRTSLFETLNSADGEYGFTYYPGTSSADTAAKLVVTSGEQLTANFTLSPERRHVVRGRVVNAIDKSWPAAVKPGLTSVAPTGIVRRYSAGDGALIRYEPRDGTFEVADLLPGVYTISMQARSEDDLTLSGSVTVAVADSDIESAGLTLELMAFK